MKIWLSLLFVIVSLAICAKEHNQEEHKKHNHEEHGHDEGLIELDEHQKKFSKIEISEVKHGSLKGIASLPGEFRLNTDRTANLMPRMPGFVTDVFVSEGDKVKGGQTLVRITSHKLGEYYSQLNTAIEHEKIAKSELEMAEKAYPQKSISRKDYLRYKKAYVDAVVERERAQVLIGSLKLDMDHSAHSMNGEKELVCTTYEIKAPFDGIVLMKNVTVGENFPEDNAKVLLTISDVSKPWLDLQADESEIVRLKKGMDVEIKRNYSEKTYKGKILFVSPVMNEVTRTGLVRVMVENPDENVRPGAFATGTIHLKGENKVLLVKSDAIYLVGGMRVVFVPDAHGHGYLAKDVKTGESANGYTQIISGLHEGDKYVSSGAFVLKSIMMTRGMTGHEGHGH